MKFPNFKDMPIEQLSGIVLKAIISVTAIVFLLFFLIGFDEIYEESPEYNEPAMTNMLIWYVLIVSLSAFVSIVVAVILQIKKQIRRDHADNRVPRQLVSLSITITTIIALTLMFVFGSSDPIIVNGEQFTNWIWLKATDMFIGVIALLLIVAFIAVIVSSMRVAKNERNNR